MKLKSMAIVQDDGGLKGTNRLWRVSILVIFFGLIVYIIGYSTDMWCGLDKEDSEEVPGLVVDAHFGLWRKCMKLTMKATGKVVRDDCKDMDNDDAFKPASKSLCSVGLILCFLGWVTAILAGCRQSTGLMGAGGFLILLGAIVSTVGCTVYIAKAKDEDDRIEPYYSVFFALIGAVLLILGGGLELMSIKSGYTTIA